MYESHPDFATKFGGKKCDLYTGLQGTVNFSSPWTITLQFSNQFCPLSNFGNIVVMYI